MQREFGWNTVSEKALRIFFRSKSVLIEEEKAKLSSDDLTPAWVDLQTALIPIVLSLGPPPLWTVLGNDVHF